MPLTPKLLDLLVCPISQSPLIYDRKANELISLAAKVAYPVRDDIPILLEQEARSLNTKELEYWRKQQTPLV